MRVFLVGLKPLPAFCSFLWDAQCTLEVRSEFCGRYHFDRVPLATYYDAVPGVSRLATLRITYRKRLLGAASWWPRLLCGLKR